MDNDELLALSDGALRARKFALIQKLCHQKNLPYPPELIAYLDWLARQRDAEQG